LIAQQNLSVKAFQKLANDLDARVNYPQKDQNGDVCAIIKVVTTETGFNWDGDQLGITKVEKKTGEYWLYVPFGAKRLTIQHAKLGILRNYSYPEAIQKASVYEMILSTSKIVTTVLEEQIASQWLVINSDPSGADIYIDDQSANQTPYQNELPLGKHTYRLSHDLYLPSAGSILLTSDKKESLNLVLKPDFGTLSITSSPENGAMVSIDGLLTNKTTPCRLEQVKTGEHTITLRLNMYKTATEKISMQPEVNINLPVRLTPTFSEININTNPASDIYIAGEKKGNGTWAGRLLPGIYLFEARKEKYTNATEKLELVVGQPVSLSLQPKPKIGILKVMTIPTDATILLEGENKGTTPATLKNLLIGDYNLVLTLDKYATFTKTVTIVEGEIAQVNDTLVTGRVITFHSDPSGANLFIDDKLIGITPFNGNLTIGSHSIRIEKSGKKAEKIITVDQTGGDTDLSLNFIPKSVVDVDGNVYKTVVIGMQTWMGENLKVTKFNDGQSIPLVDDRFSWSNLNSPGYCWQTNNPNSNKNKYGALYNWYTVNTKKLCPIGWHVPSDSEWTILSTYLGGEKFTGGKLKVKGTTFWLIPNIDATNETGFGAISAGMRYTDGSFGGIGVYGNWWSSSERDLGIAYFRYIHFNSGEVYRDTDKFNRGLSVRCLQD